MNIYELGYTNDFEDYRIKNSLGDCEVGRIITEHKERYVVRMEIPGPESNLFLL